MSKAKHKLPRRAVLAGTTMTAAAAAVPAHTAPAIPESDLALLRMEQEIAETYARLKRESDEAEAAGRDAVVITEKAQEPAYNRIYALEEAIAAAPAVGLVGVAVKLRRVLDLDTGLIAGMANSEPVAIRSAYDVLMRLAGPRAKPLGPSRKLFARWDEDGEATGA